MTGDEVRKKLEDNDDALRLLETKQVANQPHRQGSRSDMAESELGRFILIEMAQDKEEDRRAVYTAGLNYFNLVCSWRRHKGIPMPHRTAADRETGFLSGEDITKKVAWLREKIRECDAAMGMGSRVRLIAAKDLILDDAKPHPTLRGLVKIALLKLMGEF